MVSAVAHVFATLGAVLWSIQLLPQVYVNWRRKDTTGLQPSMMLLWASAGIPLGVYNVLSGDKGTALIVQPQILTALSLATWSQCMFYGHHWTALKALAAVSALGLLGGLVELALILPFKLTEVDAPHGLLLALAILSATLLALGVLRHYLDIYIHRSVRGISFWFVALDAAGDLTSLISVAVERPVDDAGIAIYAVELGLWIGIMLCGVVYNLRSWLLARQTGEDVQDGPQDEDEVDASSTSSSVFHTAQPRSRTKEVLVRMRLRRPGALAES